MAKQTWLTRDEIDAVLEQLSAADLVDAYPPDPDNQLKMPIAVFNSAAVRLNHGVKAIQKVRLADLNYLSRKIGEVVNVDSPLSEGGSKSPDSPEPGESNS